jgi:hypothetical protein
MSIFLFFFFQFFPEFRFNSLLIHPKENLMLKSKVKFYAGIEHVGGDMYVSIPEGDAIIIKVS